MSSVNKKSLREEADRVKNEFNQLLENKKITEEVAILFQSMMMLLNLLIAIFLEKTTIKNSKNSSKPPSQTEKDESSSKKGTNGKGPSDSTGQASNTRTIESTTVIPLECCPLCKKDLRNTSCDHYERRTKIDLVFEKKTEHVDIEVKGCPNCLSTVSAPFPTDMPGPLQYGNGLKAFVINLLACQMLPLHRTQKMINTIMGVSISEATLLKFILNFYHALASWEYHAKKSVVESMVMNVDETSCRVDKKNHRIHVYSTEEVTLKFLHRKRGLEAINAINILPRYQGTVVHDCLAAYFTFENCDHGLCGSHLTRELTAVIEANDYLWAKKMKKFLLDTCKKVSARKRKKLNPKEYTSLERKYSRILCAGQKELPPIVKKKTGKRGRIAKSDAHNLLERLQTHKRSVLLFSEKSYVPFTNNRAERDLRMSKVKQKISGCFRALKYAKAHCRISSYLQTMAMHGYNALIAIEMALKGEFLFKGT